MAQNLPDRITKTGGAAALSATTGIKFQPVMVFIHRLPTGVIGAFSDIFVCSDWRHVKTWCWMIMKQEIQIYEENKQEQN